jgi:hypothetical protein
MSIIYLTEPVIFSSACPANRVPDCFGWCQSACKAVTEHTTSITVHVPPGAGAAACGCGCCFHRCSENNKPPSSGEKRPKNTHSLRRVHRSRHGGVVGRRRIRQQL